MSGKFTKSWSFFGPRRPSREEYLGQHYQPSTPSSRINLQQRFGEGRNENLKWRQRCPLPPPPTQPQANGQSSHYMDAQGPKQMPRHKSFDFNRLGGIHSHYANIEDFQMSQNSGAASVVSPRASTLPRLPLRDLPPGVAPVWNSIQDNVSQSKAQTSRILHEGGKKLNRALQGVRTSVSSFAQIFRSSTRRRYKLDGGTPTRTPRRTPSRGVRQTPGKLYSPFDLSTPRTPYSHTRGPKRLQNATPRRIIYGSENRAMTRTPQHPPRAPPDSHQWTRFHSPSQNFKNDVTAMSQGMGDFQRVSNVIVANTTGRRMQFR